MSFLLHALVLTGLFLAMGYLTTPKLRGRERWRRTLAWLAAVGIAAGLVVLGAIGVLLVLTLITLSVAWIAWEPNVFVGTLIAVVVAGLGVFAVVLPLAHRVGVTDERLQIIEYYIQWSLIYVTIYQVAVDELRSLGTIFGDRALQVEIESSLSGVIDPGLLVVLLLPVLIAVWIAVAMLRIRIAAEREEGIAVEG